MNVEVYSRDNCRYCTLAKNLLATKGIAYEEISATDHREALIERVTRDTGDAPKSVPQIYIDGKHIGGYDQLVEFLG